ncbi:MAG: N-6 DNA methylase [Campylobacterota bacterium]|nr:N-6 DNA methylase [Campylobacterota bacterium]
MANESITDDIVRDFFKTNELYKNDKVIIEKQSTKTKKIDKLLINASKSGGGKGYPDFIIQYKENPNLIIVIESKADTKKHKSDTLDKYKDYAVDGVLLYSSFLSKEYDVLAIAVSGEDKNKLKISHFLQLRNTKEAHNIFNDDKLLNLSDYENGYKTDERKFNQDFQELLKYSKTLNDKLHTLKVKESERSLLISGTLIALTDKAFCTAYKLKNPKSLSNYLITTIEEKLTDVQNKHIENIISSYSFIKTHTILSIKENELRDIIDEIDEKINNFIKTYKYFDTLGQFYIEFLRYANNDKGLGIVLTPPHITDLFSEIANVNKDSIVLDTCTGTGGFLISAMRQMIIDAGGDKKKELEIKSKQIVGVEIQHDIFSLVCSNMYIHGDGRSNLLKGGCFDEDIKKEVAIYKPNVGFLNPPYKSNKNDTDELEFILNNLEQLEKGSFCIAIIPMSCALANSGTRLVLKEKLLKEHTLEATFSMPNELFHNSKVGVNTCVMLFKAKEKHPDSFKTYFAYWKDDGFSKKKTGGRNDYDNKWAKIKKEWIDNYRNKDEIAGHSIKQVISPKKEWCAEAFMETDYSLLNVNNFEVSIKEIVLHYFKYEFLDEVKKAPKKENYTLKLNIQNWKYFNIEKIFEVKGTKSFTKTEIKNYQKGNFPYIVTSSENNGVQGLYDKYTENGNVLTIDSATVGSCFYQKSNFSASDHVEKLVPRFDMNIYIALFILTIINLEKIRYGYGRKFAQLRIKTTNIKLPQDNNGNPDWKFIEDYIKSLSYSSNI